MVDHEHIEAKTNRWQSPNWYCALSLGERISSGAPPSPIDTSTKARQRLQSWKQQKPFDQGTFFADRLATEGLTEQDLLALFSETPADLQARIASVPDWLQVLREVFVQQPNPHTSTSPIFQTHTDHPALSWLQTLAPLIRYGIDQVQTSIQNLTARFPFLPFDPQKTPHLFLELLPKNLLFQGEKTFVLEMHVARLREQLTGETSEERFASFARYLSHPENLLALLEEYPVLARQFVLTIQHWAGYACEVLTHLCQDWEAISALLAPEQPVGPLTKVQEVGDLHHQGRSTLLLTFASGFRLLYKPKALGVDVHFQQLLAWLNGQGAHPPFRLLKLLDRSNYGWSEFIETRSCTHPDEVARFYERQGAYLALLYALNATDFHAENVIAAGEHPVLVDLEALFCPQITDYDPTHAINITSRALEHSVLRIGLLPVRIWSSEESDGIDLTGMGGQKGQMTPQAVPQWTDPGTDQMKIVRRFIEVEEKQNRPKLDGRDINVLDYKNYVISGFSGMYRLLCRLRTVLIEERLPAFAHDKVRVLVRPTQTYATLLAESFHPNLLRDALERNKMFDLLWLEVEQRPYLASIIPAEQHDLLRGDIPLFTTFVDHSKIYTSDQRPLPITFARTGLQLARQRVMQLNEPDLARQSWVIEAALSSTSLGPERHGESWLADHGIVGPIPSSVPKDRLLTAASDIGKRVMELALYDGQEACWLGLTMINERVWSLMPTEYDLYNGTTGIAFFLAYLGSITRETAFTRLARGALATVQAQIAYLKKHPQSARIGVFDGLSSAIYLFMHLAILWNEPALLREAEALTELLPPLIAQDERLDVMSGAAGCLLNLVSLYSIHPTRRLLEIARLCGDRLMSTARVMPKGMAWQTMKDQPPLGGFSHGTTGIALSLLKLAGISREDRFYHMADAALAYDRSLFLPDKQNWRDLRRLPSPSQASTHTFQEQQDQTMVAWCHGAAGIALGRLAMLDYLDDSCIREEIEIALRTLVAEGLTQNHSLCHGTLGNLDVLLYAAQCLEAPQYREQLEHATAAVIAQSEAQGWFTGVVRGIETPGLMLGLAGIGYELLRLAEPAQIPSVLLVAPPPLD